MNPEALDKQLIDTVVAESTRESIVVETLPTAESTNQLLLSRAAVEDVHTIALLAEQQTAGRGRSGRRWVSPRSDNIYLSMAWRFPGGLQRLAGLSLAVGVVVAEAVEEVCGVGLGLKWPNDIVHPRGKVGGVLIETATSVDGSCTAVVGVGLNVGMSGAQAEGIDQPWRSLHELGAVQCSRNILAGRLIAGLADLLAGYEARGFAYWRTRWEGLDALRGQLITADGAETITGEASGVADDGGLRVITEQGERLIYSGEARLRKSLAAQA